jgi:hypothetical protein
MMALPGASPLALAERRDVKWAVLVETLLANRAQLRRQLCFVLPTSGLETISLQSLRSYKRVARPHCRILQRVSINAGSLQRAAGLGRPDKSRACYRDAPQPNKLQR